MKENKKYNTFDRTVFSLCLEIDELKEEVAHWKSEYDKIRKEYAASMNAQLKSSQQAIGNALKFALAVKDDADGNLVITKDKRDELAKDFKVYKDKNGDVIEKGCSVLVPEPDDKFADAHNNEFVGTVVSFHDEYVTVEDGDGDCYDVEPERVIIQQ